MSFSLRSKPLLFGSVLCAGVALSVAGGMKLYNGWRRMRPVTVYAFRLPSGMFVAEDSQHPRLKQYLEHEHLDQVIKPHKSDLDQILALAKWTSQQWTAGTPFPHYPPWDAQVILDRIRRGKTGGFCAQYAFVFGQA